MHVNNIFLYSILSFFIVLIAGCSINLIKQHYVLQIIGTIYSLIMLIIRTTITLKEMPDIGIKQLCISILPFISLTAACLLSMAIGLWIFPNNERKL